MRPSSPLLGSFAALFGLTLAASCAPAAAPSSPPKPASPTAAASAKVEPVAQPEVASAASSRPPPPVVTKAMAGDPTGAALHEVRLVHSSCTDDRARAEVLLSKMNADVDDAQHDWRVRRAVCWAPLVGGHGNMWGASIGDSFGAGGLGLSGVGEGGGGRGEGIGLGSIGTIGHGSGTGSGSGFGNGSGRASHFSRTNDQVEGVDEADIVKTDGAYVYLASNGALRIIEALHPRVVSVTKMPGAVRELFVEGDRAVVYTSSAKPPKPCTYGYDCTFRGDGTATHIQVLDVSNRESPKAIRDIDLSGSLMAARRVGRTIHTVVADGGDAGEANDYETWPDDIDVCTTDWHVVAQKFADLRAENERKILATVSYPTMVEGGTTTKLCGDLYRTALEDGKAFTTIVSFSLDDDKTPATTATLESRPGAVFASADALYLSVTHARANAGGRWYSFSANADEVSEIHKFKIGDKPSDTAYVGSGVVPGHVLNQFSIDEWAGYLRVATTKGRVPDPKAESVISILREGEDHNLVRVGAIDHIAPKEDIRAVRFDGDRGYVVTFKKTDPLFVVDLYDPASPAILGELKIPGFSTYMHRLDPTHLLSIGLDADDHGSFAYFNGVILQLFDVTNATDPKLLFKEKIGSRGSSSEALTNHLAFNYFAEKHLLAIPMTICDGGGDGQFGDKLSFSGLLVYDVTIDGGFKKLGGIDHGKNGVSCSTWWSNATSAVERSVFLDDLVYSIAGDRVKVQRLGRFGEDVADIALDP